MTKNHAPSSSVLDLCRSLGFVLAGIAPARPVRWAQELIEWLESGKHGEMDYLARHLEQRLDPDHLLPGVKSVICVADRHSGGRDRAFDASQPARGRIARYARGRDYHAVMKKRLHALCDALASEYPAAQFRACVDTAPILEREHAQRAGLGAVGKHTLLIQPGVGSYLLLAEVLTTLELDPTPSLEDHDPCGSCTRCIDACPTDAISPWSVDATKCVSYLTIEHRSAIDEDLHEPIGEWLFGCDICQEVCPHNQPTRRTRTASSHEAYQPMRDSFDLLEVLNWSENDRREAFTRSAMKRAKLPMMKRNAIIVAGNALRERSDDSLQSRIEEIAQDDSEDDVVRETAQVVLQRLDRAGNGQEQANS